MELLVDLAYVGEMARFIETNGVVLLGGSNIGPFDLAHCMAYAPSLYVADAGVAHLDVNVHRPRAVIGDFDSISPLVCTAFGAEDVLLEDQNRTDFEKSLEVVDAPFYLCIGFLGGRLDHELAAYNALSKNPDKAAILVGEESFVFLAPERFSLNLPKGTDIGLFPMAQTRVQSSGLKWPLDGIKLSPSTEISSSNKMAENRLDLIVQAGKLLVVLPRELMDDVLRQMFGSAVPA